MIDTDLIGYAVAERFATDEFRLLGSTQVLWSGWEPDYAVALVELPDGRRELVTLGEVHRMTRADLVDRIEAYKAAIVETEALIGMLDENGE